MKTFEQIINFRVQAGLYMKSLDGKETKLSYAIKKVDEKVQKHFDDYNEAIADVRIDHAATDADDVLVTTEKGDFRFTKEGLKSKMKADKALAEEWENKSLEVDAYFATDVPDGISEDMYDALEGFVISDNVLEPAG